jgi:hypothetical protein
MNAAMAVALILGVGSACSSGHWGGVMGNKTLLTCIFCRHYKFFPGDLGYSEYTPGYDATMYCGEGKWEMESYEDTTESLRSKLLKAVNCPSFELVPDEEIYGK